MPRKIDDRRPNSILCIFGKANAPIQKRKITKIIK